MDKLQSAWGGAYMIHFLDAPLADFTVVRSVRSSVRALFAIISLSRLALAAALRSRDEARVCLYGLVEAEQQQPGQGTAQQTAPSDMRTRVFGLQLHGKRKLAKLLHIPVEHVVECRGKHSEQRIRFPHHRKYDAPVHDEGPDAEHDDEAHETLAECVVAELPEAGDDEVFERIARACARARHVFLSAVACQLVASARPRPRGHSQVSLQFKIARLVSEVVANYILSWGVVVFYKSSTCFS